MDLEEFYPSADELVEHEVRVLEFLRNDPYIKGEHSQFALDVGSYLGRNRNAQAGFEFFSYLDVSHDQRHGDRPNLRLIVAARIERQGKVFTNVTYCLCVCRKRNLSILRKFHFDVTAAVGSGRRRQPHPRCHIQYCGEMIPQMQLMGIRPTQMNGLNPWLSEPRILAWPTSLALLLDMTLHEFPNQRSEKFRAMPEWRSIVRAHESLVLRPFIEKALKIIKGHGSRQTLGEAFYVG